MMTARKQFQVDSSPDYPDVFAFTYRHGDTSFMLYLRLDDLRSLEARCRDALASYERLKQAGFPGYFVPQ